MNFLFLQLYESAKGSHLFILKKKTKTFPFHILSTFVDAEHIIWETAFRMNQCNTQMDGLVTSEGASYQTWRWEQNKLGGRAVKSYEAKELDCDFVAIELNPVWRSIRRGHRDWTQ